jgi:predicted transcriptional regulator
VAPRWQGLKEVFADPLLSGELPGDQEVIEIAEAAPNASAAILKLHRAYREQAERLSDLSSMLAREGHSPALSGAQLPIDEVREVLENRPNHHPALEEEAEAFHHLLKPGDDLMGALKAWLRTEHGVVVRSLPVATMPNWRRRYDRHSQRLFLSERLSPFDQLREVAMEASLIRMNVAIAAGINDLKLSSDEARRIARFELARYAAHALMMPYQAFHAAAQRARYDIDVLKSRFGVSFEQAANRVTTLCRPSLSGVPFFMLEVDVAGHRFRRAGAQGFPQQRFGGNCPKLSIHAAFSQPVAGAGRGRGDARRRRVPHHFAHARGSAGRLLRTAAPHRHPARLRHRLPRRDRLWRRAADDRGKTAQPVSTPVGPACRLCERAGCLARAEPPITRPLGLDEMVTGLSAFDFQ